MNIHYARTRIRVARRAVGRLEPRFLAKRTVTLYPRHAGGFTGR